jgi:hypothetical protein
MLLSLYAFGLLTLIDSLTSLPQSLVVLGGTRLGGADAGASLFSGALRLASPFGQNAL